MAETGNKRKRENGQLERGKEKRLKKGNKGKGSGSESGKEKKNQKRIESKKNLVRQLLLTKGTHEQFTEPRTLSLV